MTEKVKKWSSSIRKSYILRLSAYIAVNTTIMKSLGYPLAALTLTETQCDKLMGSILNAALPKMGIVKNIGSHYLYGPKEAQG